MRCGESESEAGKCPERLKCRLDLTVEMQHHLAHQWRVRSHFVSEQRHGTQHGRDEIEPLALPQLFLRNRGAQKFKLCLLREGRGVVKRHEVLRTRRIVYQHAQRWRIRVCLESLPFRVLE